MVKKKSWSGWKRKKGYWKYNLFGGLKTDVGKKGRTGAGLLCAEFRSMSKVQGGGEIEGSPFRTELSLTAGL